MKFKGTGAAHRSANLMSANPSRADLETDQHVTDQPIREIMNVCRQLVFVNRRGFHFISVCVIRGVFSLSVCLK